jgi:hypothetical protein
MNPSDFEKLGVFYLGRERELGGDPKAEAGDLLLYDSKDLVTHGVVLGMTGSGKTGLCLSILEEAAMDGIPAIAIDPKGDIPNLMLTFPNLAPADFRPWINEDDARRAAVTPDDFAAQQAELWKNGLAKWGEDGARIAALKAATQVDIFTPGSTAGIPISLLSSFDAPGIDVVDDTEVFSELIESTVSGLLSLIGVAADPVRSREHILLSNIMGTAWRNGQNLNMPELIKQVQKPPFQTIGVMDLEGFFPTKERFELSMLFNNLLASPGFATWMQGVPLDIQSLLYTPEGKPRVSILSIAHLSDTERMFFVSLLLNRMVSWMRSQPGTTSLRALLYMDEIYGYLPPSENPPSKKPMMTLLKQARAFGVGVLLASQNPVDLDYKALSNIGTWFLGRLQTERDKLRVLEGLKGAAAANNADFDQSEMDRALSGLGKRVFLMNNVHEGAPVLFETRWTMSYLRGPMTKSQIQKVMKERKSGLPAATAPAAVAAETSDGLMVSAPLLPATVEQFYEKLDAASADGFAYAPSIYIDATVFFDERAKGISETRVVRQIIPLDRVNGQLLSEEAELPEDTAVRALGRSGAKGLKYQPLPKTWLTKTAFTQVGREIRDQLYRGQVLEVFFAPSAAQMAKSGESEAEFRIRLGQELREKRDQAVEAARQKFAAKLAAKEKQILTAKAGVDREKAQANAAGMKTIVNVGSSIFGALLGGRKSGFKSIATKGAGAFSSASSAWQQQQDVKGAEEKLDFVEKELEDLKADLEAQQTLIRDQFDPVNLVIEKLAIRPKQKDVTVKTVALLWRPEAV